MNLVKYVERLWIRLRMVASRGVITHVDDSGVLQKWQVNFGPRQVVDGVIAIQQFGFSSNPPLQSDAASLCLEGDRSKSIAVGSNPKTSRPRNLEAGASIQYDINGNSILLNSSGINLTDKFGNQILMTAAGITIKSLAGGGDLTLEAANVRTTGNILAAGDITDNDGTNVDTMADFRNIYNIHNHDTPGVADGSDTKTSREPNQLA